MDRGRPKDRDLMKLSDAPKVVLELTGVTRVKSAIYQWARIGLVGYAGRMVKLRTTKRFKTLYTTRGWLSDFIKELGNADQASQPNNLN